MADKTDRLAGTLKGLDQCDRRLRFGQVPQRAMTAWVEHGVEVVGVDRVQLDGVGQGLLGCRVASETTGLLGLCIRLIADRVQRWLAASRGCQYQFGTGVFEGVIGRRKFFEPEAG